MADFEYGKLLESMKRFGFTDPLTVRPHGGVFQIIDGEHRLKGASELGMTELPYVNVGEISDEEAMSLGIILNELKGRHDPKLLGQLLDELMTHGKAEDILVGMPFTDEALKGLVTLSSFDWSTVGVTDSSPEKEPSPKKGIRWVERTFRLPAEANDVIQQALDVAKDGDEIEDWQALERVAADFLAG